MYYNFGGVVVNNLLERNIYDVGGNVLVCGTCLPNMEPDGYKKLSDNYDTILYLCLEKEHINMAITKICGMLSTGKINSLSFASVNKSPHCTQLHYIKNEIMRVMNGNMLPEINNFVIEKGEIYKIDDKVLSLSKNLVQLSIKYQE